MLFGENRRRVGSEMNGGMAKKSEAKMKADCRLSAKYLSIVAYWLNNNLEVAISATYSFSIWLLSGNENAIAVRHSG